VGLFDLFSRNPSRRIEKLAGRMLNEHHQAQVRQESLEELAAMDTPEAATALIRRLGVNFRDTIVNEQEKKWVSDTLVEKYGERAVEPLIAFIRNEQSVSAAIRVLARLVGPERLVDVLVTTLQSHAPQDHRTITARVQLVDALADLDDPRILPAVVPYLHDHDDDVRIKVCEALETKAKPGADGFDAAVDGLAAVLKDATASSRIRRRAAEALRVIGADLGERRADLAEWIPEGYALGADGRIAKA
jgi:HEAT repeat protein